MPGFASNCPFPLHSGEGQVGETGNKKERPLGALLISRLVSLLLHLQLLHPQYHVGFIP